jgi:enamine deaminase RidA (YjgF/YER057c/UK114 family)
LEKASSIDRFEKSNAEKPSLGIMRRLISTGSPFERTAGYSRAVVQGDWCFVSGTTGYNYRTMEMPDDVAAQTRNGLTTINNALAEAGFGINDVVRAHYFITDASFADIVFPILGETFGEVRPAATMIVCGLIRPEMKIEIEVTALRQESSKAG